MAKNDFECTKNKSRTNETEGTKVSVPLMEQPGTRKTNDARGANLIGLGEGRMVVGTDAVVSERANIALDSLLG